MATIDENIKMWDKDWAWKQAGDEWSTGWGGTDMEWYFTIFPRIHSHVPVDTILEIAPGYGRWTQFLTKLCKKLILVDSSDRCIKACKERFKEYSHISYFVNDGKSLDMLADESVDFVFSFDSLVHAEEDVIESYLINLSKKMRQNSAGFIHHSNCGSYETYFSLVSRIKNEIIKHYLAKVGIIEKDYHWRARSMTADKFRAFAEEAGLQCISQEIINWETKRLIDSISIFTKKDPYKYEECKVIRNRNFTKEVKQIQYLSELYKKRNLSELSS